MEFTFYLDYLMKSVHPQNSATYSSLQVHVCVYAYLQLLEVFMPCVAYYSLSQTFRAYYTNSIKTFTLYIIFQFNF